MQIPDLPLKEGWLLLQGNPHSVSSNYVDLRWYSADKSLYWQWVQLLGAEGPESAGLISPWDKAMFS